MKLKLIDKDAVAAEIEKRQRMLDLDNPLGRGGMVELQWLKDKLDTLEVKEVELDKPLEGIKVQTSMESGSLDEVIVTTKYKAQKGE